MNKPRVFISSHRILFGILAVAAAIRLIAAVSIDFPPRYDEVDYRSIAQNIASGAGFSIDGVSPTAYRAPGYPYIVATVFTLFGESPVAVRMVQAAVDTVTVVLVYLMAGMFFSRRTAEIAAGLYALYPGNFLYVPFFLSETFVTPVLLSVVYFLMWYQRERSVSALVWCGICTGVLTALRPHAAIIVPLFFLWKVIAEQSWIASGRTLMLIGVIAVVIVSPWIIRNVSVFDHAALTSNGGVNFWIGHNEGANGSFKYSAAESPLEQIPDEFDRSAEGYRLGVQFLLSHPLQEIKLTALKFFHFFEPDFGLLTALFPEQIPSAGARAADVYRNIPVIPLAIVHGTAVAVILSALWSLLVMTEPERQAAAPLTTIVAGWIVFHLLYFAVARYRVPIMPFIIILAAHAVVHRRTVSLSHLHVRHILITAAGALLLGSWLWIAVRLYVLP